MKRFILLLAVLCIGVQAHAGLVPKAKIGIKAGWNYQANKLKGAKDFDFNSDSGWYAGLQSELTWGMLGIRPELIYSRNTFDVAGPTGIDGSVKKNTHDQPELLQLAYLGFLAVQLTSCPMSGVRRRIPSGVSCAPRWDMPQWWTFVC